ncbi:ammonium transporter [Rhodobacter capsulatus]|jgi:Amt family ammonium transporter|uniref:Ammonium transporter n=1 Tax=Rhodobacter capsulatus (strain ATCC BAA-309 / NBRC 16581 / SB1003) TaxID=272942 RepID=D5ASL9_RHOCB|nr:ammonium transporter [Rhodobacter capsulatus]ADE87110.1 ammonium transporter [Rhodobacter capsulatus SB 1003]ETD03343.1 ammonia channel protein [Rhodobacter capsulatus DE442]ETD78190.1 ammonia channel protein [Rhodobacter capsulatus B6]ETD80138.1 ammonia channel protein [Rhodobacter capsulatus R121]ETD82867.1 ammonia channel protein [Rhodobacter capsulatus YW1]
MNNLTKLTGLAAALAAAALPAFAQEAAAPVAEAVATVTEAAAPIVDKGDVAWMMTSTLLVLFMIIPGLALFYGGLVRSKNMLSVLMQTTMITSVVMIVWVLWGYSFAFGGGTNPFWGGLGKVFLAGVTGDSLAATFTDGVMLPEYVFIAFQMTFAAITPALYVGAFAERMKFSAVILFTVLWVTVVYFPIAHMVWDASGLIFNWGAIDFAGGTVVHINAGITGLMAAIVLGPRVGFGRENMAPHSMTLTMVGAMMLWVGWFGFNAGSNLEATSGATLAMLNTFVATAAAVVSWSATEALFRGKASGLGAASGMVAGLVAITPACGTSGPVGAILLGLIVSPVCYFFVTKVKAMFKYDDSLDVFGVHGIGGIVGAVMTGVLMAPGFGGTGGDDFSIVSQVIIQIKAVVVTIAWAGIGSIILLYIVKAVTGLRVATDDERQGLDLTTHGESAYHS